MSKNIFIVLRDTASNFESEVKVLKVSVDFNDALATFKENIEQARELAREMNYDISESVGDLTFVSFNPENRTGEHYNVSMIRQQLSGENKKDLGTKLSDSFLINKPHLAETIEVTLTPDKYPIAFERKVRELIGQGAFNTKEEAEKWVKSTPIVLELYYEIDSGLFAVESEALESSPESICSPYSKVPFTEQD